MRRYNLSVTCISMIIDGNFAEPAFRSKIVLYLYGCCSAAFRTFAFFNQRQAQVITRPFKTTPVHIFQIIPGQIQSVRLVRAFKSLDLVALYVPFLLTLITLPDASAK